MLINNLNPEVAERPEDLVVYGGTGKTAGNWESFWDIVSTLQGLDDKTLLVQSGKPVAVFRTHPWAPRVLIVNSLLVPEWTDWKTFRELEGPADDVRPDDVLDAHGASSGVGIPVEHGRLVAVGPAENGERLPGRAPAPGFVSNHSHAFQRGLRGGGDRFAARIKSGRVL